MTLDGGFVLFSGSTVRGGDGEEADIDRESLSRKTEDAQ